LCNLPTGISNQSIIQQMQFHPNTMNAYISLLDVKDVRIVKIALEAVEKTLCAGHELSVDMTDSFETLGGLDTMEELQNHQDNDIYEKAVRILEVYFNAEEEQEEENIAPATASTGKEFVFGNITPGCGFEFNNVNAPPAPSVQFNFGTPTKAF
jgi:hypothetical protein